MTKLDATKEHLQKLQDAGVDMTKGKCDKKGDCAGMAFIKAMNGPIAGAFVGMKLSPSVAYSLGKGKKKLNFLFSYCPSCGANIAPKEK